MGWNNRGGGGACRKASGGEDGNIIKSQPSKMHCIFFIYFILQYLANQCYMFRFLMGSSSGIRIKVTFHKTELTMYIHIADDHPMRDRSM
jgi:hypothetical protein